VADAVPLAACVDTEKNRNGHVWHALCCMVEMNQQAGQHRV